MLRESTTFELEPYTMKFKKLIGIKRPLGNDVLFSSVLDHTYLNNLIISKDTPFLLNCLVNNPSLKVKDIVFDLEEFLEKTNGVLKKIEENRYYFEKKRKFQKKYKDYLYTEINSTTENNDTTSKKCNSCLDIDPQDFREVYLDYNATTYLRPEVKKLLKEEYNRNEDFENPSSNTVQGKYLTDRIMKAKKQIASNLFVEPEEIIFTSSGSESNNLALKGIAFNRLKRGGHIITSKIEHNSILETMKYLETLGFEVTYLDVNKEGKISPDSVEKAINKNTFLVSIMAVNNEIGTINSISEIGYICKKNNIYFMVDAVQAFGKIYLNPKKMGISLLSFSGHKIYAPKGIGGLYIENGLSLVPQIHGGGHEFGLRSGTENITSILALAKASELAHDEMESENKRITSLRNFFLENLIQIDPELIINGSLDARIPNNLNIGFHRVDSGALLKNLNKLGISVSTSSACSSRRNKTSHVLKAIGSDTTNYGSIRFSFGLNTKQKNLEYVLEQLSKIIPLLKETD
ncbi:MULTISPECIES: cysteine desulfurase family protein [unclassified Bacillus cereus group]|uniref:cysteine desulfurase family protein n=1 Tax=Bacillus cereus group TaxID=86661 RepID=UPI0011ED056F|nr:MULTISPECIES: cysteine desulfurase family protein [unclassified Bacillus cereus group]QEL71769.1 cysteine desulfurase [Bacillus sp. AR4-2]QEL77047.1 cysteine desulfurase [Bacillus sp. SH8-8]